MCLVGDIFTTLDCNSCYDILSTLLEDSQFRCKTCPLLQQVASFTFFSDRFCYLMHQVLLASVVFLFVFVISSWHISSTIADTLDCKLFYRYNLHRSFFIRHSGCLPSPYFSSTSLVSISSECPMHRSMVLSMGQNALMVPFESEIGSF